MKSKKAIEMSFNFLFAIIAGGIILSLMIYGSVKIFGTMRGAADTEDAAELVALLNSFKVGVADSQESSLSFNKEIKINTYCSSKGNFGHGEVSASTNRFGNWGDESERIRVYSTYFFSPYEMTGNLKFRSEGFFAPFKVDDLIFFSNETYCFYGAPNSIKRELSGGGLFLDGEEIENCEGKIVCFGYSPRDNCQIIVTGNGNDYEAGFVTKNGVNTYFVGSLMYGAIVSSEENYWCGVERLLKKTDLLARVYKKKIGIMTCGRELIGDLDTIISEINNELRNTKQKLTIISQIKSRLENKNDEGCGVF